MITAIEIVQAGLDGLVHVPVTHHVPRVRPERFVRVDQGPPREITPVADQALVIIQVYAPDDAAGEEWAIETSGLIHGALAHRWFEMGERVFGWEVSQGPHPFPDPDVPDCVRWQLSGTLLFSPTSAG
ncbi:hypothetical protein G7Y31_06655 [Corynebacterium lizhenjunii]|uniref:Tail terminator n=1 Tax=Corynebacterium lizhenjunii TaxID=2709394 RepID=A0A7T0KDI3_9CORY|nr:hypothetical protein [Corynebacterium lizhenjunii]QPK78265.1 hypothetical protein G7Y31_06655 [Corynebacterium lizhenjunii]